MYVVVMIDMIGNNNVIIQKKKRKNSCASIDPKGKGNAAVGKKTKKKTGTTNKKSPTKDKVRSIIQCRPDII